MHESHGENKVMHLGDHRLHTKVQIFAVAFKVMKMLGFSIDVISYTENNFIDVILPASSSSSIRNLLAGKTTICILFRI